MWSWFRTPKRSSSARRTYRRFRPVLEQLEPRWALSANVAAFVAGGNLVVYGSNLGANIIVSQPRIGQITLAGNGITTVNGSTEPVTFSGVTRDLNINFFGNGGDLLAFDETNPITLSGNLTINGAQGSNTVITLPGPGYLNVGGNLSILNLPGATKTTELFNLNVRGNVQILNLGGDASVSMDVNSAENVLPSVNTIGGNLLIYNGPGSNDQTNLSSINVKGTVQVQNLGATAGTFIYNSVAGQNSICGNLLIYNGPGSNDQTNLSSINVKGSVQIVNQAVAAATVIDSLAGQNSIGGNLQINNGLAQDSQTQIGSTNIGRNLQVAGYGSGDSSILLLDSETTGDTDLTGGNGNNTVTLDTTGFGGGFQLQTGNGGDTTVVVDAANFGGAFLLQSGNGADTLSIGKSGPGTISHFVPEQRVRTVTVNQFAYEIIYTVYKPVYETIQEAGPVTFNGPVTVGLGGGDDTLNLAIDAEVTFLKAATLNGQNGQNTANVHTANLSGVPKLKGFQVNDI